MIRKYHNHILQTNPRQTDTPFLDLDLSITNGIVSSKKYYKQGDFNSEIVMFPFLDGDVPHIYLYISQLISFCESMFYC